MSPPPADESPAPPPSGLLGKRREFLLNRRLQLRGSLLTAAAVLAVLVVLNLVLYGAALASTERILVDAPYLEASLRARDRLQLVLVALASLVFLAGVVAVGILETHRTAGAAHNIARRLVEISRGRYGTRVVLRRGDNLRELAVAVNELAEVLARRTARDNEALERLASEMEQSAGQEGRRAAARLRELARGGAERSD